jgi:S1-C subfamily serine protease
VVVRSVTRGSPADTAVVQPHDVMTALHGTAVADQSSFARLIDSHRPGDSAAVTTPHGGQTLQVHVTVPNAL